MYMGALTSVAALLSDGKGVDSNGSSDARADVSTEGSPLAFESEEELLDLDAINMHTVATETTITLCHTLQRPNRPIHGHFDAIVGHGLVHPANHFVNFLHGYDESGGMSLATTTPGTNCTSLNGCDGRGAAHAVGSEVQQLQLCITLGDLKGATRLINEGASVAGTNHNGQSLAHTLVINARESTLLLSEVVLKLILQQGIDVNIQDYQSCTALMYACRRNLPTTAALLVQHGASTTLTDAAHMNARFFAVMADSAASLAVLCEAANACPAFTTSLHSHRDKCGRTALHWCAIVGSHPSFGVLLGCAAVDIVAVDHRGETVAHLLAQRAEGECTALTKKLIEVAPPDCIIKLATLESVHGFTPEQVARARGNTRFVDTFVPALACAKIKHASTPHSRNSLHIMPQLSSSKAKRRCSQHARANNAVRGATDAAVADTGTCTGDTRYDVAAAERSEYHRVYNKFHRKKAKKLASAVEQNLQALEERNCSLHKTLLELTEEAHALRPPAMSVYYTNRAQAHGRGDVTT